MPFALQQVHPVQAEGLHAHEHLAFFWRRLWRCGVDEEGTCGAFAAFDFYMIVLVRWSRLVKFLGEV
jgi:hypothetical protein